MARLDAALVSLGLVRSRALATKLITDGLVSVDGVPVVKPSTPVTEGAVLAVEGNDHYVSRAAHKLIAGLDAFAVAVAGRPALDMGASTGGFTQVLRERGADPVVSVDVGHDQLAPEIAADASVHAVEGYNVRHMTRENLAAASGVSALPEVITGDLSFISLELVLPAVVAVAADGADAVLLVKPQFEVGRTAVKGGLVTDPSMRADAVTGVLWAAWDLGWGTLGVIPSPIVGTHGNREFVVHLAARGENPTTWMTPVARMA